ncbi:MAG: hypothetical protein V2I43_03535, partial [Parvularcula sp.]|nr:hypothetical protein [Parvularcula sp.]
MRRSQDAISGRTSHLISKWRHGNNNVTIRPDLQLPTTAWTWVCEASAFDEVGETGEATPDDGRPWGRIGGSVEVAAEARDGP